MRERAVRGKKKGVSEKKRRKGVRETERRRGGGVEGVSGICARAALCVIFVDFGGPTLMGRNYVILEPVACVSPGPKWHAPSPSPIIFHQACNIYRKCLAILTNTLLRAARS